MICNKLKECYEAVKASSDLKCISTNKKLCVCFSDYRPFAKCEENRKKYIIHNVDKDLVTLYKVDGGMIIVDKTVPLDQSKCDFLFCVEKKQRSIAILIELKGTDVRKALKQVDATYDLYKDFFEGFSDVQCRIIVTNSTPKIYATPAYVSVQRKLKRKNGGIVIQEKELTEEI